MAAIFEVVKLGPPGLILGLSVGLIAPHAAAVHVPLTAPPLSHQLANPDSVEGLVLINIDTNARGWIDWAAQKVGCLFSVLSLHLVQDLFYMQRHVL